MKVVVLGSGYLGHATACRIAEDGTKVTIISRNTRLNTNSNLYNLISVNSETEYWETAQSLEPDVVVSAFGTASPNSVTLGGKTFNFELNFIYHLIELIKNVQSKLIFFSSGGTIYGEYRFVPFSESSNLNPISPYGKLKLEQEKLILKFLEAFQEKVNILRISNPYGSYSENKLGGGFINTVIRNLHQDKPIRIYGNGDQVRDFIHIEDIVNFVSYVARSENFVGITNVGSGIGFSLNEIVGMIEEISNKNIKKIYEEKIKFDVQKNILSISKLNSFMNIKPRVMEEELKLLITNKFT